MGFEIHCKFHPRKEDGGYNTELKEEKIIRVGKPFDDTSLEKCAAAIMLQLARRDVWVIDVNVYELVKNEINFKESADGRGIVLKNKKYNLGSTADVIAEDLVEEIQQNNLIVPSGMQPHEMISQKQVDLFDPNARVPVVQSRSKSSINKNKVLYHVYFEPYFHKEQAKRMKLKFTEDRKYPVHEIIPSLTGKLDAQKIAVSDDDGKVQILDEKFFTTAGKGLIADDELGFSGSGGRTERPRSKLMHEDDMFISDHEPQIQSSYKKVNPNYNVDIPIDNGEIPEELLAIPDIRKK